MQYVFDKELQEAVIAKRNSQFTMNVELDGEVVKCHCPATTRIGDVDLAGVHCLVSKSDDLKREFTDSELRLLIDSVLFSSYIPYKQDTLDCLPVGDWTTGCLCVIIQYMFV